MKRQQKRGIDTYFPSPTSKPILQKKVDSKTTPGKLLNKDKGILQEEMEDYGGILWCAAETKCTNTLKAATSDIVCSQCQNNVHNDCCDSVEKNKQIYIYCLKCLNINQKTTVDIQEGQIKFVEQNTGNSNDNYNKSQIEVNNSSNNKHGSKIWCAAKTRCNNQFEKASEHRCSKCRYFAHAECRDQIDIKGKQHIYCLLCITNERDFQKNKKLDETYTCKEPLDTQIHDDRTQEHFNNNQNISFVLEQQEEITFYKTPDTANLFCTDTSVIEQENSMMEINQFGTSEDNKNELNTSLVSNQSLQNDLADHSMTDANEGSEETMAIIRKQIQQSNLSKIMTRDAIFQALAIMTNTQIKSTQLNKYKMIQYFRTHQQWLKTKNVAEFQNSTYKVLAAVMDTSLVSKKRQKKAQLQLQRQDILNRFCDMDEQDITLRSKSIYLLAKISGIFFDNDTIILDERKLMLDNFNQIITKNPKSIHVFNTYSANIIGAQIQEFLDKEEATRKKVQVNESSINSKVIMDNGKKTYNQRVYDGKITRVEIRLNMTALPTDTTITGQLYRQIQELVDKIAEVDPAVKILPWFLKDENVPLENNKVPEDKRMFTKYFQRFQPKNTGFVYGEMRLQHERRWEDIVFDLTPWLTETKSAIYFQHLQCQSTTNLGWLLWSFRRIDTTKLQQELQNLYNIKVNLRYQNISEGKGPTNQENIVRALHVIADQTEVDYVTAQLQKIYSFTTNEFPLGIVLRFIPHTFRVKQDKLPRIIKWRNRQRSFLQGIENQTKPMSATSWEITQLDAYVEGFGTLRKNLMKVMSKVNQKDPLFLSIDTSFFRSNEVIFSFLPRNESEARMFVTNVVPYIQHKYDIVGLKDIFQQEALQRASQSVWNADSQEILSQSDLYLEQSGDIEDDFDMLQVMGIATIQDRPNITINAEVERVERLFSGDDDTSIGTLFTTNQTSNTFQKGSGKDTRSTSSPNTKSGTTTLTNEQLEQNMKTFSTELAELKILMTKMITNQNISRTNQNATKDDAGGSNMTTCNTE
jgi:hypothetical protein